MSNRTEARYWSKVQKGSPNECWPWLAAVNWRGAGFFSTPGHKNVQAHRYAWQLAFGPIPEGAHVLHTCDNPGCCNPAHLFIGDHNANMRDKSEKGRARRGLELQGRLTEAEVVEADRLQAQGVSWAELGRQYCDECLTVFCRGKRPEGCLESHELLTATCQTKAQSATFAATTLNEV